MSTQGWVLLLFGALLFWPVAMTGVVLFRAWAVSPMKRRVSDGRIALTLAVILLLGVYLWVVGVLAFHSTTVFTVSGMVLLMFVIPSAALFLWWYTTRPHHIFNGHGGKISAARAVQIVCQYMRQPPGSHLDVVLNDNTLKLTWAHNLDNTTSKSFVLRLTDSMVAARAMQRISTLAPSRPQPAAIMLDHEPVLGWRISTPAREESTI